MKDPIQVFVGSLDLAAVHSVRQTINLVTDEEKTPMVKSDTFTRFSMYGMYMVR